LKKSLLSPGELSKHLIEPSLPKVAPELAQPKVESAPKAPLYIPPSPSSKFEKLV
jgi:hypothetical protein